MTASDQQLSQLCKPGTHHGTRINTATDTVVAKVPVGRHPAHVVVASDGRTADITNGGDNTSVWWTPQRSGWLK